MCFASWERMKKIQQSWQFNKPFLAAHFKTFSHKKKYLKRSTREKTLSAVVDGFFIWSQVGRLCIKNHSVGLKGNSVCYCDAGDRRERNTLTHKCVVEICVQSSANYRAQLREN